MKVLHVYRTYFPDPEGGLQEAIRQIALSTQKYGVESRIFTLSPNPLPTTINRDEGTVLRMRSWWAPASCDLGGPGSFLAYRQLANWADIVHFHFPWPFADMLHLLATPRGKKTVMTYHSDIVRQEWLGLVYEPLMKWMLRSMNAVVATSPAYAQSSRPLTRFVQPSRLREVPLGIAEESYMSDMEYGRAANLGALFGVKENEYFLAVGVLRYYKGLHTLIEAARESGLPVLIAGSGPERTRLEELARGLPAGRCRFLGRVSNGDKMALIRGCRALVLPSQYRSEAFGMVLVEAAMVGRALISCEIGTGTTFVNIHNHTGLVVKPGSVSDLAKAMHRLASDEKFAALCGRHARERYEQLFSGEALGAAYSRIYEDVIINS
jgi:rhamnosyl/mannosyltransferase